MRNHPAFQRLLTYVDANALTLDQIKSATSAQVLRIMYPPDGVRPPGDHLTKELVIRGLAGVFRERRELAQRQRLREKLEAAGIAVEEIDGGARDFTVRLRDELDPNAVGALRP